MRRAGYKWYEAMLDILDNGADALRGKHNNTGFEKGLLQVKYPCTNKKVSALIISDNGTGIEKSTLKKILKMGWSAKRGTDQLGTFGMGLKTAGISLGNRIRVISSTSDASSLLAVEWDVEQIMKSGKFTATFYEKDVPDEERELYLSNVGDCSGTVVVIDKLLDIVPKTYAALCATLTHHCSLNYRHMLNENSPSGYQFPFNIKLSGKKDYLSHNFDPLLWDSQGTTALIGSKTASRGYEWGGFKFEVRLVHHRPENCVARAYEETLGAGIRARSGLYFVRGGRTISAGHYDLLKYASSVSNVYGEVFFTDTGVGDFSPIQMDFGKKGVLLDGDFEKWIKKHIFRPWVKKIAKEQQEEAKKAKKSDRSKVIDHVSTLNLPADVLGREQASPAAKAANIFSSSSSTPTPTTTAKRKYRGTSLKVGDQDTSIKVEEVAWKGSDLPFIGSMEAGNPEITIQLNVEHPWVEKNIYLSVDAAATVLALQLATASALSVIYEEDHLQEEVLKKQGMLLNLLGDHFGGLFAENTMLTDESPQEEPFLIEENPTL
jgi:hypothetical protein